MLEGSELPIKKIPINPVTTQAKQVYNYEVDKLIPGADYNVKLLVKYKSGTNFTWPNDYNQTVSQRKSNDFQCEKNLYRFGF